MVLCMSSMILGGCIPSPKKQTEAITVEENPNMMYMLVGSYATPEEEGIKVYNFDEQNGNSQYISGIKGISNPSFLIPSADGERIYAVGEDSGKSSTANAIKFDKEQKKLKSRMVIPRPLRYTAAPTAVDANIKPAVCINIMPKRILRKTR